MSDFKIHHHITELVSLLRKGDAAAALGAEEYADLLLKAVVPYLIPRVGTLMAVKKLSENSSDPEEVKKKYTELKAKNMKDLDALVYFLGKISEDDKTKMFLARNAQENLESPACNINKERSSSATVMTVDEMTRLRNRLRKEACNELGRNLSSHAKAGLSLSPDLPNVPKTPSWITARPYLTLDFVDDRTQRFQSTATLGAVPLSSQEHTILNDLLWCLGGISGEHIGALPLKNPHAKREFYSDETVDPSFQELVQRILPVCSNYSLVSRFIDEKSLFPFGQVNHSLCAAMRSVVKDYLLLVAQLEQQHRQGLLTLQRLWVYIQSTVHIMDILAGICSTINKHNSMGGCVLSVLHERTCSMIGDPKAQELCLFLTQAACVPYFEILEKWIYKGIISDPFREFMVEDNEWVNREKLNEDYSDEFWEKRVTICKERIPIFLEKVSDMILRTGKYLNVIRQCGQDVNFPDAEAIVYTLNEREYVEKIEKSYSFSSKKLLGLLLEEKDLLGRLKSVKHYFLLDQGDFIVQFMDMADEELKKNINDIMPTRLESLLELALRTSVANNDPYKDDVRVVLLPFDLISQMFRIVTIETKNEKDYQIPQEFELSGFEAFSFYYDVKWPLSLILNHKVLAEYQMIFRQLLYLKNVERLLCNVWISHKVAKCFLLSASRWYAKAFALRQKMLHFVQDLGYYMMFEVIEPSWNNFMAKLNSVANVEDVLNCHFDFLNICLKDCMLTSPELLIIINKLMKIFIQFSNFILQMNKYSVDAEMTCMLQTLSEAENSESRTEPIPLQTSIQGRSFEENIETFDGEFSKCIITLLDRISDVGRDNEKLFNILYRVDFNNFYTDQREKYKVTRSSSGSSIGKATKRKPPVPPKSPKVAQMRHTPGNSSG